MVDGSYLVRTYRSHVVSTEHNDEGNHDGEPVGHLPLAD